MNKTNTCEVIMCDRPSSDGTVCSHCVAVLQNAVLAEVAWIMSELDTAIAKQARFGTGAGKVSQVGKVQPLIIDVTASDARQLLVGQLASWCCDVAEANDYTPPRFDPVVMSAWLADKPEAIRMHPAAGDMIGELSQARATAVYVIDRPMEKRYLGECDGELNGIRCGEQLFARDGDTELTCKVCGECWIVEVLREQVKSQAFDGLSDRIMTATQAAEALVAHGLSDAPVEQIRDKIRKWADRGRLAKRIDLPTPAGRRRPGYRFGDVTGLHAAQESRQAS